MDAELQNLIDRANKWCEQAAQRTPEKNALVARALIEDLAAYAAPKLPEVGTRWKRKKPRINAPNDVTVHEVVHHESVVLTTPVMSARVSTFLRDFEPAGDA
jgi:hypothetical protein